MNLVLRSLIINPVVLQERDTERSIDWARCVLCGSRRLSERLRCPKTSKGSTDVERLEFYAKIHRNIHLLWDKGILLPAVKMPKHLTVQSLFDNSAKWHDKCKLAYSDQKVQQMLQSYQKEETAPDPEPEPPSQAPKRSRENFKSLECVFCQVAKEGPSGPESLHAVCTIEFGTKHRDMALEMNDTIMSLRLDKGDLIASEGKYHRSCATAFYNRYKRFKSQKISTNEKEEAFLQERVYMELFDSIKNDCTNGQKFFPMVELRKQYDERKKQLNLSGITHSTRLRERIVADFEGDMTVEGVEFGPKTLVFGDGLKTLVQDAVAARTSSQDLNIIAKAAKILREDIFEHTGFQFNSSFPKNCHSIAVPFTVLAFCSFVATGTSIKDQAEVPLHTHTVAQMLYKNAKKSSSSKSMRDAKKREPPIPLELGLYLHHHKRDKATIQKLNHYGLSPSYWRIQQVEKEIASTLCEQYALEGAVVPGTLKKNTFTVAAIDNIDFPGRTIFGSGELHGTFISATQHPTDASIDQPEFGLSNQGYKIQLPDEYSQIYCLNSVNQKKSPPALEIQAPFYNMAAELEREKVWADSSHLFIWDELEKNQAISWAGYMANQNDVPQVKPAVTGYFPIFEEKAATFPMLQHGMKVVSTAVEKLNPGQIPILVGDQPIFAIMKQIQWQEPTYSEDKFVVSMGALHIEMCMLQNLGKLLDGSQWEDALVEADVVTTGRAQSVIHGSNLKRSRFAHEVSVLTFRKLKHEAYMESKTDKSYNDWNEDQCERHPTFFFWDLILRLQMLILMFVRSLRERNFDLYVNSMEKFMPILFSLDATNYRYRKCFLFHLSFSTSL